MPAFFVRDFGDGIAKHMRWSRAIEVMAHTSGTTTFVESSLPPRPTSSTTAVHPTCAKCSSAAAVISLERRGLLVHPFGRFAHLERHSEQIFIGNIFAVHLNALIEAQNMRRSEQANLSPPLAECPR